MGPSPVARVTRGSPEPYVNQPQASGTSQRLGGDRSRLHIARGAGNTESEAKRDRLEWIFRLDGGIKKFCRQTDLYRKVLAGFDIDIENKRE